jgi:predicted ferric reductase
MFLLMNCACLLYGDGSFANNLGSLAACNLLLVTLPSPKGVVAWATGWAPDVIIDYHRPLGTWLIFIITAHMLAYWTRWYQTRQGSANDKFIEMMAIEFDGFTTVNAWGFYGWCCCVAIGITSFGCIRRKKFQWFIWTHSSFLLLFVFSWLHSSKTHIFIAAALISLVLDRLLRTMMGIVLPVRALKATLKPGGVVALRMPKSVLARKLGLEHRVGQHILLNFPALSLTQWHPFSLSSAPREASMEVHIKALGDHSARLVDWVQSATARGEECCPLVRVQGPFGNLEMNYRRYDRAVFVAGGIGITPIISILKDCFNTGDVDAKEPQFASNLKEVHVCWVVRSTKEVLCFSKELSQCMQSLPDKNGGHSPRLIVSIFVTGGDQKPLRPCVPAGFAAHFGRPNLKANFEALAKAWGSESASTAVLACGPTGLVNACWDVTNSLNVDRQRWDFHHENFKW